MNHQMKNIMLGIGIGLILASIVNLNFRPKNLTIEDVKREAARYNLIVLEADKIINTTPTVTPTVTPTPNKE